MRILGKNGISPKTICEIGCGAGEILKKLNENMPQNCEFWGYEISPQAFELCKHRINERLHFKLGDATQEKDIFFDLILVIDVLEHLENYFDFLRAIKHKSKYKVFHIPLDMSIQRVLRGDPLIRVREQAGHIHYFTKDIALQMLKEVNYKIIDYFYTSCFLNRPSKTFLNYVARFPRNLFYVIHKDWAVRILGGYSLMVLAE